MLFAYEVGLIENILEGIINWIKRREILESKRLWVSKSKKVYIKFYFDPSKGTSIE